MNTSKTQQSSRSVSISKLNLAEILDDMFLVLTDKEKDVIVKRFSLNNQPKMTLEKIGQQFSVTRERIRQIEKIALGKLKRTVQSTKLNEISELALELIQNKGGVSTETGLISEILNIIVSSEDVDANIIRLALNITPELNKTEKSNIYYPFWRTSDLPEATVKAIVEAGISQMNKNSDVIDHESLAKDIQKALKSKSITIETSTIISALEVDQRVKRLKGGFGLMSWRHINPRSIRDKAYIILKDKKEPLHFIEIANNISEAGFDKKVVTTQAVHNELIRYDQFVLVGRGLYALKEWGYKKGTVADVIEGLLDKKSPLSKQQIIDGVMKQRQVKKGTISLNLQKNAHFVRVGRAMYSLDMKKK
ncbi:sigma factor-like helix-turn-helix DNA-binding protein [Patescibacteria group bacterium]